MTQIAPYVLNCHHVMKEADNEHVFVQTVVRRGRDAASNMLDLTESDTTEAEAENIHWATWRV